MGQRWRDEYRRPGHVVPDASSDDSPIRLGSPDASRPAGIHSAPLGGHETGTPPTTHARISLGHFPSSSGRVAHANSFWSTVCNSAASCSGTSGLVPTVAGCVLLGVGIV